MSDHDTQHLKAAGCPEKHCDDVKAVASKLGISLPQVMGWATTYGPEIWSAFQAFVTIVQSQPKPPAVG